VKKLLLIALISLTFTTVSFAQNDHNVLLIIADDLGIDVMPNYMLDEAVQKANMPNLEALMARGITFDNVWSSPTCSPTRATLLTGRYGFRTNVLSVQDRSMISPDEYSLHEHLSSSSNGHIASSIIGKWHLSGGGRGSVDVPAQMAVEYYAGFYGGAMNDYYNWSFVNNGQRSTNTSYMTSTFTDLAVDWINNQDTAWFAWVAYTAPHTPFHLPPEGTHSQTDLSGTESDINANPLPYYIAMVENLDYEIGRLLAGIPTDELANTTIIFIGDNGTSRQVIQAPYTRNQAKNTVYEGGIHVPMIVAGAGVTRIDEREDALVNVADIFPTVSELFDSAPPANIDGQSFVGLLTDANSPSRDWIYSENLLFERNGNRGRNNNNNQQGNSTNEGIWIYTIRDASYKLIQTETGDIELYNLAVDPYEAINLYDGNLTNEEQTALSSLQRILNELHTSQ